MVIHTRNQLNAQETFPGQGNEPREEAFPLQDQQDEDSPSSPAGETEVPTQAEQETLRKELETLRLKAEIRRLQQELEQAQGRERAGSYRPMRERFSLRPQTPQGFLGETDQGDPFAIRGFSALNVDEEDEKDEKDLKGDLPDLFSGDRRLVDDFLMQGRLCFMLNKRKFKTEERKVLVAISRFRGEASMWIRPYLELPNSAQPAFFGSFMLFARAMKEQWPVEDEGDEARMKLDQLQQTTSASEYLAKFSIYAPYTGYDDQALINHAENGLKKSLFIAIRQNMGAPRSFDQWKQWVIRFDNALYTANRQLLYNRNTVKGDVPYFGYGKAPIGANTPAKEPVFKESVTNTSVKAEKANTAVNNTDNYRKEGRCYECSQVGHIGRDCPVRKERYRKEQVTLAGKAANVEEYSSTDEAEKD
jgi:hypothetical protein